MSRSGWWSAASASKASRATNAMASGNVLNAKVRVRASPLAAHPECSRNRESMSGAWSFMVSSRAAECHEPSGRHSIHHGIGGGVEHEPLDKMSGQRGEQDSVAIVTGGEDEGGQIGQRADHRQTIGRR